jgi:very-short-patch-repair endonuclease/SAM-dependent methyltransferase
MNPTIRDQLIALNARFYQEFAASFSATRLRLQPGVERILPTLPLDSRLLDLGCGNGELARRLAGQGFRGMYVGIDFSPALLSFTSPTPPSPLPPHQTGREGGAEPSARPGNTLAQVSIPSSASPPSPFYGEGGTGDEVNTPPNTLSFASPPSPFDGEGGRGGEVKYRRSAPPALWNKLKPLAREMRHEPTPGEDTLWQALRNRQLNDLKFRRQHPIDRFLVDFYCPAIDLVIEVDGPIHQYTVQEDALRQQFLESIGLHILRFTNDQVLTVLPAVLATIRQKISTLTSPPSPFYGEGGQGDEVNTPQKNLPSASSPSPFYGEGGRGGEVSFLLSDLSSPTWDAALPAHPFDAILAFAVLHHLPGADLRLRLMQQVRQRLTPGGRFIHSEWQFHHSPRLAGHILPWETIGLARADVDPGDTLLDWRQGGRGLRYVHLFNEAELSLLALSSGFALQDSFYSDGRSGDLALYQIWS